jgi:uroporphyrinogen-III synthase
LRILITRPRDQALVLTRTLEAHGHEVVIEPLLAIEPLQSGRVRLDDVQAILLTSANAAHALPPDGRHLPVLVVGGATARAARAVGCMTVLEAGGEAASLARLVRDRCSPAAGALLHLCGEQVREGLAESLAAAGFELRRQVVYRAQTASELSAEVVDALRRGRLDAVRLLAPRTARTFVDLVIGHGLDGRLGDTVALCLSEAVAEPCRELPFAAIRIAARPELDALLERLDAPARRW